MHNIRELIHLSSGYLKKRGVVNARREAEELLAEADRRIGEEIALKENLAGAVTSWMTERQLTHESAASQLGVDLSVISKVVRQHLNEFSIGDLFSMAFRTGKRFAIALH